VGIISSGFLLQDGLSIPLTLSLSYNEEDLGVFFVSFPSLTLLHKSAEIATKNKDILIIFAKTKFYMYRRELGKLFFKLMNTWVFLIIPRICIKRLLQGGERMKARNPEIISNQ